MSRYVNEASTYAIGIIFPVLCTISVGLRFLARRSVDLRYGADDWIAVAALIGTIGCGAILVVGAATQAIGWTPPPGVVLSVAAPPPPELLSLYTLTQKLKWSLLLLSIFTIGLIRLTFVFLYRRIFERYKYFEVMAWVMIGIIISWMVAFFFAILFTCGTHFEANWGSFSDLTRYCPNEFDMQNAMAISDVILDILILLMPIVPTCQLRMSSWRKGLVLIVFSLGIFSIGASLTRTVLSVELSNFPYGSPGKLFGIAAMADPIGIVSIMLWWTYMEIGLGCLVSNLPPTIGLVRGHSKALLQSLRSKLSSRSSRTSSSVDSDGTAVSQEKAKARAWYDVQVSTASSDSSV